MPRLQDEHLEVVLVSDECDRGREVQVLLAEALDLEALRHDDVFAVAGVVVDCFSGTGGVSPLVSRVCHRRLENHKQRKHASESAHTSD